MSSLKTLYEDNIHKIRCEKDAVMICLHNCLISNGMKCERSEFLPQNWTNRTYTLPYYHEAANIMIGVTIKIVEGYVFIDLFTVDKHDIHTNFILRKFITNHLSEFETSYKNLEELEEMFQNNLIKPLGLETSILMESYSDEDSDNSDTCSSIAATRCQTLPNVAKRC